MSNITKAARSRKDMVDYLENNSQYVQGIGTCLFAFNVKAYTKFEFDHLYALYSSEVDSVILKYDRSRILAMYEERYGNDEEVSRSNGYDESDNSRFLRSRFELEQMAYEAAQSTFIDSDAYDVLRVGRGKQAKSETIIYPRKKHHYSGITCTNVADESVKTFGGNQGGYAVYEEVDGYKVVFGSTDTMEVFLYNNEEYYQPNGDEIKNSPYLLPFKDLRRLYNFHKQMSEYLNQEQAKIELNIRLADYVFDDVLGELRAHKVEV